MTRPPCVELAQERLSDLYADYRGHRAYVACHALVEFGYKVGCTLTAARLHSERRGLRMSRSEENRSAVVRGMACW